MKNLLGSGNTKLMKDGIFHWSIPAFMSETGFRTCPGASTCIKGCYARQGFHGMSWVKNAKERRLTAALSPDFTSILVEEIRRRRVRYLRVHDAGDFFSKEYFLTWMLIADLCPDVKFYAYTKMVPMVKLAKRLELVPANFEIIFSFGGRWDRYIDISSDHHAKVFRSHEAMPNDYVDASVSDLVAIKHRKVGLVYHGGRRLNWGV